MCWPSGVDRLDYTKGIPERLKSFRLLLRRFPEMRGHITLVQVVVPSREEIPNYKHLRRDVELLVSQINGELPNRGGCQFTTFIEIWAGTSYWRTIAPPTSDW